MKRITNTVVISLLILLYACQEFEHESIFDPESENYIEIASDDYSFEITVNKFHTNIQLNWQGLRSKGFKSINFYMIRATNSELNNLDLYGNYEVCYSQDRLIKDIDWNIPLLSSPEFYQIIALAWIPVNNGYQFITLKSEPFQVTTKDWFDYDLSYFVTNTDFQVTDDSVSLRFNLQNTDQLPKNIFYLRANHLDNSNVFSPTSNFCQNLLTYGNGEHTIAFLRNPSFSSLFTNGTLELALNSKSPDSNDCDENSWWFTQSLIYNDGLLIYTDRFFDSDSDGSITSPISTPYIDFTY